MDSDLIMINKFKTIKKTRFNNIIKLKDIINIILLLFGIILIFFLIYSNIGIQKLLKHFLKYVNNNINDKILLNKAYKDKDIKNRINLLKTFTNNNPFIYKHMSDCLLNDPDKLFCIYHLIYPKKVIGKNRILLGEKSDGCYVLLDDFENIFYM